MDIDANLPLPADTDLDRLIESQRLDHLAALIHTHDIIGATRHGLAETEGRPDDEPNDSASGLTVGEMRAVLRRELDRLAPVTALHVLRATEAASNQLSGDRHRAIAAARADGQSWSAIGAALKMSKQGAQDWFNKRSIPMFQDHAADRVDTEPARDAVADDDTTDTLAGHSAGTAAAVVATHLRSLATVADGAAYLSGLGLDTAALREVAAALDITRLPARISRKDLCERVLQQAIGSRIKFDGLRSW
ncbi:hypothetical protein ACFQZZ_33215 [Nocardia sp. GCM10030253]|uniref:hypothetical protein n=1 Tax=Nocardia sp. GCM10030253 TaxID=3273404 RepID=UPI00363959DF